MSDKTLGELTMHVGLSPEHNVVLTIRGECEIHVSPESALQLAGELVEVARSSPKCPTPQ